MRMNQIYRITLNIWLLVIGAALCAGGAQEEQEKPSLLPLRDALVLAEAKVADMDDENKYFIDAVNLVGDRHDVETLHWRFRYNSRTDEIDGNTTQSVSYFLLVDMNGSIKLSEGRTPQRRIIRQVITP